MHQAVEQGPAAEASPGEEQGDEQPRDQARQRGDARDLQAEPQRAPLVGREDRQGSAPVGEA